MDEPINLLNLIPEADKLNRSLKIPESWRKFNLLSKKDTFFNITIVFDVTNKKIFKGSLRHFNTFGLIVAPAHNDQIKLQAIMFRLKGNEIRESMVFLEKIVNKKDIHRYIKSLPAVYESMVEYCKIEYKFDLSSNLEDYSK